LSSHAPSKIRYEELAPRVGICLGVPEDREVLERELANAPGHGISSSLLDRVLTERRVRGNHGE
jgi:hypothetical protein